MVKKASICHGATFKEEDEDGCMSAQCKGGHRNVEPYC